MPSLFSGNIYVEVVKKTILFLCLLIQIIIFLSSINKIPQLKNLQKLIKLLYYISILTSLIILSIGISGSIVEYVCEDMVNVFLIIVFPLGIIVYQLFMTSVLGLLWTRLYYSFSESMFKISTSKLCTFIVLYIFDIISSFIGFILIIITTWFPLKIFYDSIIIAFFIGEALWFILSVYATIIFAINLFKLMTLRQLSITNEIKGINDINLTKQQIKLIDTISRQTVLLSIAIITTLIHIIIYTEMYILHLTEPIVIYYIAVIDPY